MIYLSKGLRETGWISLGETIQSRAELVESVTLIEWFPFVIAL